MATSDAPKAEGAPQAESKVRGSWFRVMTLRRDKQYRATWVKASELVSITDLAPAPGFIVPCNVARPQTELSLASGAVFRAMEPLSAVVDLIRQTRISCGDSAGMSLPPPWIPLPLPESPSGRSGGGTN